MSGEPRLPSQIRGRHMSVNNRIPKPIDLGRTRDFRVEDAVISYRKHCEAVEAGLPLKRTVEAERYACGFPLPSFQRPAVWTTEQKAKFIESIFLGLHIGTYCVHESDWTGVAEAKIVPFSGWLLDGQQRLLTIEDYINDKFKVFDLYFSDLTKAEVRRFMNTPFKRHEVALHDEAKIKDLYNRLNFGGTAHTEDQRAV
ncbi:MAG: hypothetical protein CBC55_02730 [Gammaproteobacteria bacterium TMED95]|nr:MAG: hypothetical protein CBC55_02730 [Gammaproteobacteria bacterium TMED95]